MLNLIQSQRLHQTLSPVQVQYLKLLQLPVLALEQRIKDELEMNPMLEEGMEQADTNEQSMEMDDASEEIIRVASDVPEAEVFTPVDIPLKADSIEKDIREHSDDEYSWEDFYVDGDDGYTRNYYDPEDDYESPAPNVDTMSEGLIEQLHMLQLDEESVAFATEIIGSLEEDGYLRVPMSEVLETTFEKHGLTFTAEQAESILKAVQRLDPPGIAARSLQECLIIQLEMMPEVNAARIVALRILHECYGHFVKKHFDKIEQELHISHEMLRKAFALILRLNPKPGEGTISQNQNYIIPDFIITQEKEDFIITLNERGIPPLRVNQAYKQLLQKKKNNVAPETRKFVKEKLESAKWFIQSIQQRRHTMLNVMTTIISKQREWFEKGQGYLRPLIYRDIADIIQMDISTISRVVNGKYAQTDWGVFELRYFFSEGIPTANGDEISNTEIKSIIRQMISEEDSSKPLSDEVLMQILREKGYDIARRTVAKYRESMNIAIARLRKKIT